MKTIKRILTKIITFFKNIFKNDNYDDTNINYYITVKREQYDEGEQLVYQYLLNNFGNDSYILNNYIIKNGNFTNEIDHILIHKRGIFVIETKDRGGTIYGSEDDYNWNQEIGSNKHIFNNPIRQNDKHVERLSKIINDKDVQINSVIIFTKADINNINIRNVINLSELVDYVNSHTDTHITKYDRYYYHKILKDNMAKVSISEHVSNINQHKEEINNRICPVCHCKLVMIKDKDSDKNYYKCINKDCNFKTNL